jgi:hypothetical protein
MGMKLRRETAATRYIVGLFISMRNREGWAYNPN